MLIALALMAQGPTLDADTTKAAMTCAAASSAASDATRPTGERYLVGVAEMTYFAMTAARPGPAGRAFLDRVGERVDILNRGPVTPLPEAKALLPQCDARFPLARRAAPSKLPLMELDRNLMCTGSAVFLAGAAKTTDGTDPSIQWLEPFRERFQGLTDAQRAPGGALANQAVFQDKFAAQLIASLDFGNLLSIARACRAL
ncbi:MAG: hypothetical protein ACAH11_09050 [Sphingomonas sp.]